MSLRETLTQLPDDYEVVIRSRYGPVEYTDRAGDLLEDDGSVIRLDDFELVSEIHLPGQNGYPLPGHLRAYQPGDIGGHIDPPDDIVIQGPIGDWLEAIEPETEATLASLGAGLIAGLGAYLGRDIRLKVGRIAHFANLFAVQVGPTSTARKGTADKEIYAFLAELDFTFASSHVVSGFGSGEALIERVADPVVKDEDDPPPPSAWDQRLYIQESEFSKLLRIADRQGNILSDVIRLAFDGSRPLANAAKTSRKLTSSKHCISLFGGITPEELIQIFPVLAAVSGTGNRYLWVWSDSDKLLPYGGTEIDVHPYTIQTRRNINAVRQARTIEYSDDGRQWWEAAYPTLRHPEHIPQGTRPMISRISDQTQRIALIYAATQASEAVTADHLRAGYAWVRHSIETVLAVLGGLVRNQEASKVLNSLRQHPGTPANKRELYDVFGRNITGSALDAALRELEDAGLAYSWEGPPGETGGRPPTLVMATTPRDGQKGPVDPILEKGLFVRNGKIEAEKGPKTLFVQDSVNAENPQLITGKIENEQTRDWKLRGETSYPVTNELTPEEHDNDLPDPW